jgi:DNA-binding protein HU-beta
MTKAELVKAVAEEAGITQAAAEKAIAGTFDAILASAVAGEKTNVQGFGTFDLKESAEREGRNPSTGAALTIAAKKTLRFKFSKAAEVKINGK